MAFYNTHRTHNGYEIWIDSTTNKAYYRHPGFTDGRQWNTSLGTAGATDPGAIGRSVATAIPNMAFPGGATSPANPVTEPLKPVIPVDKKPPTEEPQTPAASRLFTDSSYRGLLESLGITDASKSGGRFTGLANAPPTIGLSMLRNPENAGAMFGLFSGQNNPGSRKNTVERKFSDIYAKYKAATAYQPDLQFDQFLDKYDVDRLYDNTSFSERGERPGIYSRGYRLVGG